MNPVIYLIFRRMRTPLLALIIAYAIAVLGLTLIPGQDADGNPWRMDFFHAFYFVSYMSTTIGFGEIPYAFTAAQRAWVTLSIYATVIVWLYSIGTLINLLQDSAFRQAMTELYFTRHVRHLRDPFHLVCGYGETGSALVRALSERNRHAVVLEINPERVQTLVLDNLPTSVPAMAGDARTPQNLISAGLKHRLCAGVVSLTNDNKANLKVAITAKLLRPKLQVICRAESEDVEANMASFGTDIIVDPFETFAEELIVNLHAPCQSLLHDWLTDVADSALAEPIYPDSEGLWILCGFGRFGKAIHQRLSDRGIETIVIEATPEQTGMPETGGVTGRGTEAKTLVEAGVKRAVGLVAGTDDDANNLSIIMTARELNSDLFFVARQNLEENAELFEASKADIIMHPSRMVADRIRVLLATPLLVKFEKLARDHDDHWACEIISRISAYVGDKPPHVWEVRLDSASAMAAMEYLASDDNKLLLSHLLTHPNDRNSQLQVLPLMLQHESHSNLLPDGDIPLREGDQLLFCGTPYARAKMEWIMQNYDAFDYVVGRV